MQKVTIVAGPVSGAGPGGRPRWNWRVERTIGSTTHTIEPASAAEARKVFKAAILQALSENFPVFARFVEQTGAGEEAEYKADGTIVSRRMIPAREGILGPRCFIVPTTPVEKAKRTAALRHPPKPKAERKAKPPKVKAERKPKPVKEPKQAKPPKPPKAPKVPGVSPMVSAYLAAPDKAAWIASARGVEIAQVVRYLNQHGTAAQRAELEAARGARPAKPPKAPRGTRAAPPTPTTTEVFVDPVRVPRPTRTSAPRRQPVPPGGIYEDPRPRPAAPPPAPPPPPAAPAVDPALAMLEQWMKQQEAALKG